MAHTPKARQMVPTRKGPNFGKSALPLRERKEQFVRHCDYVAQRTYVRGETDTILHSWK